ncbi:MAG TPA: methyl-accepting chemotaxis protein, partial [Acidobacteriota bacterium]|nr:methyl-accepting chemotaxis protein [Acidobacteriota bacterium]
ILFLNARLRQIVDKVKSLAGSVGATSERNVDLSRSLLKLEQTQSDAAEKAMRAMQDINVAITRIARGVESLNQLGLTASSAALELTASIEEVTRNAQQVGDFAKDTQSSMGIMVKGFREISSAGEMLAQAATDTDESMKTMKTRIYEVTSRAKESDDLAQLAAEAAGSGGRVVMEVESEMHKIAETFQNASTVIGNLSHRSEQIGEILNVITQIADQTNLLSLNAAILSAQAGLHGKGFAVVADEIRKLSSRTASSVSEIEQLISRVRQEIREAADFMEEGRRRLAEGLGKSGDASRALAQILSGADMARERVSAIREASEAQIAAEREVERTTSVIHERIGQITGVIQEQMRSSKQTYSRTERMLDLLQNVEKGMQEQTNGAREVSSTVERVSEVIQNIHMATSTQSVTSSQVVQSVDRLRGALEAGTATIRALNSTALALDQESFILKHELTRFRLPEAKRGGVLKYAISSAIQSLDPAYAQYIYLVEAGSNFYEGLVEVGEGTDIRPCLAERWEISQDGLVY